MRDREQGFKEVFSLMFIYSQQLSSGSTPSVHRQGKMWSTHTTHTREYYSTLKKSGNSKAWMDLEDTKLSEICQTEKTNTVTLLTGGPKCHQIHRHKK
jgi:hypothetical protein